MHTHYDDVSESSLFYLLQGSPTVSSPDEEKVRDLPFTWPKKVYKHCCNQFVFNVTEVSDWKIITHILIQFLSTPPPKIFFVQLLHHIALWHCTDNTTWKNRKIVAYFFERFHSKIIYQVISHLVLKYLTKKKEKTLKKLKKSIKAFCNYLRDDVVMTMALSYPFDATTVSCAKVSPVKIPSTKKKLFTSSSTSPLLDNFLWLFAMVLSLTSPTLSTLLATIVSTNVCSAQAHNIIHKKRKF